MNVNDRDCGRLLLFVQKSTFPSRQARWKRVALTLSH